MYRPGYTSKTTQLSLREVKGNTVVDTATLTFEPPQNIASEVTTTKQEIELKLTPQVEGSFQYTVELPVLDGELTDENNQKTFSVKVVKAKLNVFYLEGRPRWEYAFLKRTLARDPDIEATSAILLRNNARRFPPTDSLLNRLDGYYPQTTPASETTQFPQNPCRTLEIRRSDYRGLGRGTPHDSTATRNCPISLRSKGSLSSFFRLVECLQGTVSEGQH